MERMGPGAVLADFGLFRTVDFGIVPGLFGPSTRLPERVSHREGLSAIFLPPQSGAKRMRLIVFARRAAGASRVDLSGRLVVVTAVGVLLSLMAGAFYAGVQLGSGASIDSSSPSAIARAALQQKRELEDLRARVQERIDVLSARVGQANAQLVRLDELGKRLVEMANIDSREFDFGSPVSLGGPEQPGEPAAAPDLTLMIDALESQLASRDVQLGVLESLILQRDLRRQTLPEGRPVRQGYLSSGFGTRQDPFTGHGTWHLGVDFAGNEGDPVISVGAGIVTYAGTRSGYGLVVDVAHGDGFVTRYAHNRQLKVRVGDAVTRGQQIAAMGSTGRSTGPHVHFEVLRNGRQVNPLAYIGR